MAQEEQEARTRATVLVVEDDHWTRLLMHDLLEAHGYTAIEAGSIAGAYELAQRHRPELILMDIKLQGGSGLELVRRLRESDLGAIPVVAVTALAMPQEKEMIRNGGCVDYLPKPFSSTALIDTVRRCMAA